jgi:hypothetical protein
MPRLSDIDFTIKYRPGRNLTGAEAEIAELTDSEPYALASVELGTSGFERVFDPRDYPEKEQEVLDLASAIVTAAKAHDQLCEALEMVRDADEDCKRDGLITMPPMARAKIDAALKRASESQIWHRLGARANGWKV